MRWSAAATILDQLADEGRLVLSDWRAMIFLRRGTFSLNPSQRRWTKMPLDRRDFWPTLRRMRERGEIELIPRLRHFYRATVPYARMRLVEEEEVLMEIHPYASLAYSSALFYHGLTEGMPKHLTVIAPADGKGGVFPPDTDNQDWEGIALVNGRKPPRVLNRPVRWRS